MFTGLSNTAQYGNLNGGTLYDDACPAGQVVIGYAGFLASGAGYHGQIQALCGVVSLSGNGPYAVTISAGATLPLHGLFGVTPWTSTCPQDQMVVGFDGRSGLLVDQIALHCAPLVISGPPYAIAVGAVTTLAPVGDNGGSAFPTTDCLAGQVATESRIRAGDSVDAFGIACSTPSLTF